MKVIPAVDILGGKVVRLVKGSFLEKTEYSADPVSIAKFWQDEGAGYIHIVDLDGAKSGEPKNSQIIEKIIKSVSIPVEVGGGIRSFEHIKMYLNFGADRIIVGTAMIRNLSLLDNQEIKDKADKIALSFDFRRAEKDSFPIMMAGTGGWVEEVPIFDYRGLIDRTATSNIKYINYTDRAKDGTLDGLSEADIKVLNEFLKQIGSRDIQVIYAGGISSLEDIKNLAKLKSNKLSGVIVGKALYEGKFSLKQAQAEVGKIANVS
jgi:phosphoribosylformimino-5-aminoimidazole carboxamide ribotide isomerase